MNAIIFQVLTVLATAASPAAPQNTLLAELINKGVKMPDGQVVCLPAPVMAEGLSEKQQAAVLAASAPRGKVDEFLDTASNASWSLKILKTSSKNGNDVYRTVDLCFVVYGDWNVLTSDQFSKGIVKEGKAKNAKNAGMVSAAGYLKAPELAVRGLSTRSVANSKEYFLYTTFNLFDRVELSATRIGVATKTPTGVMVAARVDSRFAKDKAYPNQWRAITKDAAGNTILGPPQPYSGAGFYAKVTRLIKPANAIFVEFHEVFYEPHEWFGEDQKLMRSELGKIIPFEVKQFRIKLAWAMQEAAEKQPAVEPEKN
jgi:hypothetical protein